MGGDGGLLVDEEDLRVSWGGGSCCCEGCETEGDDAVGAVADDEIRSWW